MKKLFKKMAFFVTILSILFTGTTVFATMKSPNPENNGNSPNEYFITIETGTASKNNSQVANKQGFSKTGPVYFQTVDTTNMLYDVISRPNNDSKGGVNLSAYSIWATNDPRHSLRGSGGDGTGYLNNSIKWSTVNTVNNKYNSRIIIRRLYKVKPSSKFSIVVTEGNGKDTGDVKACVSQYASNYRYLHDGDWHDSSKAVSLYSDTGYIIPIMRYNDGNNAVGSALNKTIGWSDSKNHYDRDLSKFYVYYIFNSFTYTINYNYEGASNGAVKRWGVSDISNEIETPSRTGYTFTGWKITDSKGNVITITDEDNKQLVKCDNTSIKDLNDIDALNGKVFYTSLFQNLTFTAQWTPNKYTVKYNANGGAGSMANSTATYDADFITRKNSFTKEGYTFNGWNEKADGSGTAWNLTSAGVYESGKSWKWTYKEDKTLYAQWIPNTVNIDYRASGGTVSGKGYTVNAEGVILKNGVACFDKATYGHDYTTKTADELGLKKTGYTLTGWKIHSTGTVLGVGKPYGSTKYVCWNDRNKTTKNATGFNSVLFAQWTPNQYRLTFNANGGTLKNPGTNLYNGKNTDYVPVTYSYTNFNTMTGDIPVREGYSFRGWFTSKEGGEKVYEANGQAVKNSICWGEKSEWIYTNNLTVYAHWEDDSAPDIVTNYKEGICNTEQTFDVTILDKGTGLKEYSISGAEVVSKKNSLNYTYVNGIPLKEITVTITVKNEGTLKITATDIVGNKAAKNITFVKTYLNNNQDTITGRNTVTDNFTSIAGNVCHPYTINTLNETVIPKSVSRKGCSFSGFNSNKEAATGSIGIKTNGKTYYAIWKDSEKPIVEAEAYEDSTGWKLKINIQDSANGIKSEKAGSDIAGYYIGTDINCENNSYYSVTCDENGCAKNITVNVDPSKMNTIYVAAIDKAGNVSDINDNTTFSFKKVTLSTRNDNTHSEATFNFRGKEKLKTYTFYVLSGTKIEFPEANRYGYHGTSDLNKSDKSSTWTKELKDDVIGSKSEVITSDAEFFPTFVPSVYTINYDINKPLNDNVVTTPEMDKLTVTETGLNMSGSITTPEKTYVVYEGKPINPEYINDESIQKDRLNEKADVLTADGWKFLGWYDEKSYKVMYDLTNMNGDIHESSAEKVISNTGDKTSTKYWNEYGWAYADDVTVYAHWMANKYTIIYDTNADDGGNCPVDGSVDGNIVTPAGENKQIAIYDTKVKLSSKDDVNNTLRKIAESKETNYEIGKEYGIITETEYVTVGNLQSWSKYKKTRALEDNENISKQIGASGTGKDVKFTNIAKNLTNDSSVTVYAVWDHSPQFEKKSFNLLEDKYLSFKNGDNFNYKEFSAFILNKIFILDTEDGSPETFDIKDWKELTKDSDNGKEISTELDTYVYTYDAKDNGYITLKFNNIEEVVKQLATYTTNASTQLKVDIIDTYGNVTHDEITIYYRSNLANEDIITGPDESTLFTNTGYTRAINKYFFEISLKDTTDWSNYRALGALRPTSVWVNDPEYRDVLAKGLTDLEEGKYEKKYSFTRKQVLAAQMYIFGKATYDEIVERYDVKTAEEIKALLNGRYTDEGHRVTTIAENGNGSLNEIYNTYKELLKEWNIIP